jgi:hypothetical protein
VANADASLVARVIERLTGSYTGSIHANGSFAASSSGGSLTDQISGTSIVADERITCSQETVIYHEVGNS